MKQVLSVSVSVVNAKGTATAAVAAADVEYIELVLGAYLDITGRFKYIAEIAVMLDVLRINTSKRLSDEFAPTDQATKNAIKKLVDSATSLDAIQSKQFVKLLTETFGLTDKTARSVTKLLADEATSQDRPYVTTAKAISDAFGLTDKQTAAVGKVISDSVSFTETLYRVLIFIRNVTDSVAVADATSKLISKAPFTDSLATNDASNLTTNKALGDFVAMDDGTSVGDGSTYFLTKTVNNVATVVDAASRQVAKTATDSLSTTDAGLVVMQNYCDLTYFSQDYVGTSSNF